MSEHIEPFQAGQTHDFEGSARQGDTLYWVGSLGNTRSGNVRLDRDIVVATEVDGSGADASLTYAGHAHTAADPGTDAPAVTPGSDPVGAGTGGSGDSGSQGPLPRTGIGWIQTAVATGLLALSAGWALRRRALLA